jgi:hypothetical protein
MLDLCRNGRRRQALRARSGCQSMGTRGTIREGGKSTTLQGGRTDDEWRCETGGGVGGETSWIGRGVANGERSETERQSLPETRTGEVRGFGCGLDGALLGPNNR